MVKQKKETRGRKKLSPEEKVQRATVSVRMPADTKARLDKAVAAKGRKDWKLNTEVVHRLEASLNRDAIGAVHDAFGGDRTFFLMMLLAEVVTSVETVTQPVTPSEREKGKWLDDPFIFQKVREGIEEVLRQIEPGGKAKASSNMLTPPDHVGAGNALGTLDGLRLADDTPPSDKIDEHGVSYKFSDQLKRFPLIKAALGPDVISRIGSKK
jgi:hypothetical protein